jgi:hypothetical protein
MKPFRPSGAPVFFRHKLYTSTPGTEAVRGKKGARSFRHPLPPQDIQRNSDKAARNGGGHTLSEPDTLRDAFTLHPNISNRRSSASLKLDGSVRRGTDKTLQPYYVSLAEKSAMWVIGSRGGPMALTGGEQRPIDAIS